MRGDRADDVMQRDLTVERVEVERGIARRADEEVDDPLAVVRTGGTHFIAADPGLNLGEVRRQSRRFASLDRVVRLIPSRYPYASVVRRMDRQRAQPGHRQFLGGAYSALVIEADRDLAAISDTAVFIALDARRDVD